MSQKQVQKHTIFIFIASLIVMTAISIAIDMGGLNFPEYGGMSLSSHWEEAEWALDPSNPGPDIPPVGQSIFDELFSKTIAGEKVYNIPWPFPKLIEALENKTATEVDDYLAPYGLPGVVGVHLPKGRSLQRDAAKPNYFRYPRVVITANSPSRQEKGQLAPNIKDRIFIGYQENAEVLEIISYNESAGRFEFQVASGYNADKKHFEVEYQNRNLCISCHQNHSPLFSRNPWLETNGGNAEVKEKLYQEIVSANQLEQKTDEHLPFGVSRKQKNGKNHYFYQGVPILVGQDFPSGFDDVTDRAVFFQVYQRLWKQGCEKEGSRQTSTQCRAMLLKMSLFSRLMANDESFLTHPLLESGVPQILQSWQDHWPRGMKIPNPNINSRDPFARARETSGAVQFPQFLKDDQESKKVLDALISESDIPAEFEPTVGRHAIALWEFDVSATDILQKVIVGDAEPDQGEGQVEIFVPHEGLSRFMTIPDLSYLNESLNKNSKISTTVFYAKCSSTKNRIKVIDLKSKENLEVEVKTTRYRLNCQLQHEIEPHVKFKGLQLYFSNANYNLVKGDAIQSNCGFDLEGCINEKVFKADGRISKNGELQGVELVPLNKSNLLQARTPGGLLISKIQVSGNVNQANSLLIKVEVKNDLPVLFAAIDQLAQKGENDPTSALGGRAFSRRKILKELYSQLGIPIESNWRALDMTMNSGADQGPIFIDTKDAGYKKFFNSCQKCHVKSQGHFRFVFLNGLPEERLRKIGFCAERSLYRMNMFRFSLFSRKKSGMPKVLPPKYLPHSQANFTKYILSDDYKLARDFLKRVLKQRGVSEEMVMGGTYPEPQDLPPNNPYINKKVQGEHANLSPCIPKCNPKDPTCSPEKFNCFGKIGCNW